MTLVKFNNGKFGVRAYWFFGWRFINLHAPHIKVRSGDAYFHQAQTDCKRYAEDMLNRLSGETAKFKVIDDEDKNESV